MFTKNRDRLLTTDISRKVMAAILAHPEVRPLLSDEHFSVDGTLVKAWASMESFQPKADEVEPTRPSADPGESSATAPPDDDDPGGPPPPPADATAADPSQPQQTETQPMPETPRQTRNAEVVTSRKVVWLFPEQLWLEFVPVLHRLQGRLAAQC